MGHDPAAMAPIRRSRCTDASPAAGRGRRAPTDVGATAVPAASILAAVALAAVVLTDAAVTAIPTAPAAAAALHHSGHSVATGRLTGSSPPPIGAGMTIRAVEAGLSAPRWRLPVDDAHVVWITFVTILPLTVVTVFDAVDRHYRRRFVVAARLLLSSVCLVTAYVMGGWFVKELLSRRERWDQVATTLVAMFVNWYVFSTGFAIDGGGRHCLTLLHFEHRSGYWPGLHIQGAVREFCWCVTCPQAPCSFRIQPPLSSPLFPLLTTMPFADDVARCSMLPNLLLHRSDPQLVRHPKRPRLGTVACAAVARQPRHPSLARLFRVRPVAVPPRCNPPSGTSAFVLPSGQPPHFHVAD